MKKFGFLCLTGLLLCTSARAQNDIPMAYETVAGKAAKNQSDGDYPNLGRRAKPLSSLVITPPPLPPITIELDTSVPPEPEVIKPKPKTDVAAPVPAKPSSGTIALNEGVNPAKEPPRLIKKVQPAPKKEPVKPVESVMPSTLDELFGRTSDVTKFAIGGFKLGMTPEETVEFAKTMGWKVVRETHAIPLYRESWYEEKCRRMGAQVVSDINTCIENSARGDGVFFVNELVLSKAKNRENMSILFTSHATGNKAYKVFYQSLGDNSLGFTPKNMAIKLRRKEMFWNNVFGAYGYPDDADLILWGDLQKSYMQATVNGANYDAYLSLEDKEIQDADYFAAEDSARALKYHDPFTFTQRPPEEELW